MKPLNEESDKKKIIIEKYNSTSSFYDDRYRKIQNEKFELLFKNTNFNCKTLLDAGCGTGLLFEDISSLNDNNLGRTLRYIGIDISWKMLKHFYNKTKKITNKVNTNLILGDIENLPFRVDKFNLIFSITSLQNLHDLKKGLKELIRVGKENTALKLSILRKQLKLEEVITYLKSHTINLRTENLEEVEDVIIYGSLIKD
ncbi:MAG: methyltransferase domain-containing protein [Candidatus Lokiarchaeota archaeon]|nr:methyltransferase domain-containing protein [Candidatus Lokiarchaeota archaeon]